MTKLDKVDYQIVSLLQEDGRMPTVEIARRIGVSEGTVRRRLANLIKDEVMRVTAVVDHSKVGFPLQVRFGLSVELDRFSEITTALAALKEIRFVHFISGIHDIWAEAWFKAMEDVAAFVTEKLATIPGIQKIETFYVQKIIKRAHFHDHDVLSLLIEEHQLAEQKKN